MKESNTERYSYRSRLYKDIIESKESSIFVRIPRQMGKTSLIKEVYYHKSNLGETSTILCRSSRSKDQFSGLKCYCLTDRVEGLREFLSDNIFIDEFDIRIITHHMTCYLTQYLKLGGKLYAFSSNLNESPITFDKEISAHWMEIPRYDKKGNYNPHQWKQDRINEIGLDGFYRNFGL